MRGWKGDRMQGVHLAAWMYVYIYMYSYFLFGLKAGLCVRLRRT